jgi:putative Holliday junction resolvase
MTLLGLDWGARRLGLAIKHAGHEMILPKAVLTVRGEADALAQLRAAIAREGAQGIVVGLPLNADPAQARQIKRFCRKAREGMTGVRWFFVDETLTTRGAEELAREAASAKPADDLAAAAILQRFLEGLGQP